MKPQYNCSAKILKMAGNMSKVEGFQERNIFFFVAQHLYFMPIRLIKMGDYGIHEKMLNYQNCLTFDGSEFKLWWDKSQLSYSTAPTAHMRMYSAGCNLWKSAAWEFDDDLRFSKMIVKENFTKDLDMKACDLWD